MKPEAPASAANLSTSTASWARWIATCVLLGVLCYVQIRYLQQPGRERRADDDLIWWSLSLAGLAGMLSCAGVPRLFRPGWPVFAAIAVAGVLTAGLVWWNHAYIDFVDTTWRNLPPAERPSEVFREAIHRPWTPIYGIPQTTDWQATTLVVLSMLTAVVAGAAFVLLRRTPAILRWPLLIIAAGVPMLAIPAAESPNRRVSDLTSYREFKRDLVHFRNLRQMLRDYVRQMKVTDRRHALGWFGQHYAPGNLLLFMLQEELRDGDAGFRRTWNRYLDRLHDGINDREDAKNPPALPNQWLVQLAAGIGALLSLPLTFAAARQVGLDRRSSRFAAALLAISWGVLIYPSVTPLAYVLLPTSLCVLLMARVLARGEWWAMAALGVVVVGFAMISFAVTVVGLVLSLVLIGSLLSGRTRLGRAAALVGIAGVAALGCVGVLWGITGLNLMECLKVAVLGHGEQQISNPFLPLDRWWLRSSGNLLAYAWTVGPLIAPALLALLCRPRGQTRLWMIGTVGAILVATFGGLFWLETERVWIFFTPLLTLAAARLVRAQSPQHRTELVLQLLVMSAALIAAYEVAFVPYR